jgi:hypothetical protein
MFNSAKSTGPIAAVAIVALIVSGAFPQSRQGSPNRAAGVANTTAPAVQHRFRPDRFAGRAGKYYSMIWGIDSIAVKSVESGEMIRFSYRVLDTNKAKMLNDKKLEPSLVDERARVKLVVPTLEKVGQMRQSSPPEAGRMYWMLFSNKGGYVKRGDLVNVVVGTFRADGLVVD